MANAIDLGNLQGTRYVESQRGRRRLVLGREPERGSLIVYGEIYAQDGQQWEQRGSFVLIPTHAARDFIEALEALVAGG